MTLKDYSDPENEKSMGQHYNEVINQLYHTLKIGFETAKDTLIRGLEKILSMTDNTIYNLTHLDTPTLKFAYAYNLPLINDRRKYDKDSSLPLIYFSKHSKGGGGHSVDIDYFERKNSSRSGKRSKKNLMKKIYEERSQVKKELRKHRGGIVPRDLVKKARRLGISPKDVKGVRF